MGGIGADAPIPAGPMHPVGAGHTAQLLQAHERCGRSAAPAGQPGDLSHHAPARCATGGTGTGHAPHQAKRQATDLSHSGGIAVRPHIGFQPGNSRR